MTDLTTLLARALRQAAERSDPATDIDSPEYVTPPSPVLPPADPSLMGTEYGPHAMTKHEHHTADVTGYCEECPTHEHRWERTVHKDGTVWVICRRCGRRK